MAMLRLSDAEREALITALDNYLDGIGMADEDKDEEILDHLLQILSVGDGDPIDPQLAE